MGMSESQRVKVHLRIAKRYGTPVTLTVEEWEQTIADFNGMCAYCQQHPYEVLEHFLPVYIAGTQASNCLPACDFCNKRKKNSGGDDLLRLFGESAIASLKDYLEMRANGISIVLPIARTSPPILPDRPQRTKNTSQYKRKSYLSYEEASDYLGSSRSRIGSYISVLGIQTYKFERDSRRFLHITDIKIIEQVMAEPWMIKELKKQPIQEAA